MDQQMLRRHRQVPPIPHKYELADELCRLAAWYALYMIFWACPPNARLDPSAPAVCRRVDIMKHSTLPYIKPYYDSYAEPYLARAHPYLQKGQEYYEQFGAPTVAKGHDLWVKQATPRIKKSCSAFQYRYKNNVYPLLDKLVLKHWRSVYSKYLDSYVQKSSAQYSKYDHPHFQALNRQTRKVFNERIIPAYQATVPYVHHALQIVETIYTKQVEPRIRAVMKWILLKFEQVIIPRATILWNTHVQPQLDRIYERLFRNREPRQVASKVVEDAKTTQR